MWLTFVTWIYCIGQHHCLTHLKDEKIKTAILEFFRKHTHKNTDIHSESDRHLNIAQTWTFLTPKSPLAMWSKWGIKVTGAALPPIKTGIPHYLKSPSQPENLAKMPLHSGRTTNSTCLPVSSKANKLGCMPDCHLPRSRRLHSWPFR